MLDVHRHINETPLLVRTALMTSASEASIMESNVDARLRRFSRLHRTTVLSTMRIVPRNTRAADLIIARGLLLHVITITFNYATIGRRGASALKEVRRFTIFIMNGRGILVRRLLVAGNREGFFDCRHLRFFGVRSVGRLMGLRACIVAEFKAS